MRTHWVHVDPGSSSASSPKDKELSRHRSGHGTCKLQFARRETMIKLAKNGFTLIELMIVVAIIGLLAALAIPNFLKFQARSKQAEARTNLKSYYTANKSYYGDKQMYL